jgi:hypothetical protein
MSAPPAQYAGKRRLCPPAPVMPANPPSVAPQVSAPLGWVLSSASQQALNDALSREAGHRCAADKDLPRDLCEPGVGHLGVILALTDR